MTLVAAVAASRCAGQVGLRKQDTALRQIARSDVARLLAITHSRRLFRSMVVLQRDYVQAKSDAERVELGRDIDELSRKLTLELDKYGQLMSEEDRAVLSDIREVRLEWLARDERVRRQALVDRDQALALAREPLRPASWEGLDR